MTVEGVAGAAGIQGIGNSGEMTLATMFAMLQLEMASEKKTQAEELINSIKGENEILRQARGFLQEARKLQAEAKDKGGTTNETEEMTKFRKQYNIEFDTTTSGSSTPDTKHKKDEWELNIKNLETFIESRGMDTQTKMVQLEDLMGKYNAWTQGASKTISDGNQLLQSIATR
jgi:hypothetical protein